jgi:hypothetical protein
VTNPSPQPTQVFAVAADGTKVPFNGTGLRVVVAPNVWIEMDFDFGRRAPVAVTIGGRARRDSGAVTPQLILEIRAGNYVSVVAGLGRIAEQPSWELVAVHKDDLKGDIVDWLRRTSSGDPLGESTLARSDRTQVDATSFVIEYGDVGTIHIDLIRRTDALLGINVLAGQSERAAQSGSFRSLVMVMFPHAANLVSLWFHENQLFSPGTQV